MPLTRREFEAAARRLWPRPDASRDLVRQKADWLFGLSYAVRALSPVAEDADFLVRLLETRAALSDNHRLLAAFPRPAA